MTMCGTLDAPRGRNGQNMLVLILHVLALNYSRPLVKDHLG